jgi:RNA polymerase sigma-70 factor (ECF subfamily)
VEREVIDEFVVALALGDMARALSRLAPDVRLISDGGATRRAARRPVVGADKVTRFLFNVAKKVGMQVVPMPTTLNGEPAVVFVDHDGAPDSAMVIELDGDRVAEILLVRNPDKLAHLSTPVALE